MKKPTNDDYMWSVYTKQFSKASWLVLVSTSTILTILLFWITQRSPGQPSLSLADSGFLILGFIFGQGRPVQEEAVSEGCLGTEEAIGQVGLGKEAISQGMI